MKVGLPKEIKNREHRVAMTPEGVNALVNDGHRVFVESGAGAAAGFSDADYQKSGASLAKDAASVWDADMVVKVKEPLPCEYGFFKENLILFTYLHLAADQELLNALVDTGVCAIAYETVQTDDGHLPLLMPMSAIAGRLAVQMGAFYLQTENGTDYAGKGLLMGAVQSSPNARVLVLGAGNVGRNAVQVALGMGANVTVLDVSRAALEALAEMFSCHKDRLDTALLNDGILTQRLEKADLLVGAALIPGEKAPKLLSREKIALMPEGSVFVDVAIDQGGMAETSRPTGYDDPVYLEQGVLHCCLPNLPGCVSHSSAVALTSATWPYISRLANQGVEQALLSEKALMRGLNVRYGVIQHPALRSLSSG